MFDRTVLPFPPYQKVGKLAPPISLMSKGVGTIVEISNDGGYGTSVPIRVVDGSAVVIVGY